jgi:hypothetical protein
MLFSNIFLLFCNIKHSLNLFFVNADVPVPYQLGFQDPATEFVEGIIDLHHDVFGYLTFICIVLFSFIFLTVFCEKNQKLDNNFFYNEFQLNCLSFLICFFCLAFFSDFFLEVHASGKKVIIDTSEHEFEAKSNEQDLAKKLAVERSLLYKEIILNIQEIDTLSNRSNSSGLVVRLYTNNSIGTVLSNASADLAGTSLEKLVLEAAKTTVMNNAGATEEALKAIKSNTQEDLEILNELVDENLVYNVAGLVQILPDIPQNKNANANSLLNDIFANYSPLPSNSAALLTKFNSAKETFRTITNISPDPIVTNISPDPIVTNISPDPIVTNISPDPIVTNCNLWNEISISSKNDNIDSSQPTGEIQATPKTKYIPAASPLLFLIFFKTTQNPIVSATAVAFIVYLFK